ncbi:retrotransposon protein, putative, ty1-copia subclass [Tanacetum coccineum]
MKIYIDNPERLGHIVSLNLGVSLILISLRKEFDSFVQNYNMHSMGKTVNELHAMLKLCEQTLTKKDPTLHAIRAGKVQKKNNKQKKLQVVCKGIHIKGREFIATTCTVANGQRAAVEAIGTYHLCLPSGLVIVLNNCHYAPSITRGIISVSRLYDDGYVNYFVDNTIQVSRNNIVYFSVVPRDCIFEIDLSNPNAINSSMYVVSNKRAKLNLDSALLWHRRLGHISKKCIEKLQHDGLLNSTDLRAFEKCVPCMSGKMARKPYTHQVERAKDLLGLIHTDVCGPFKITSRQGANYFVTFTDDFSHYGYVYLLKHKTWKFLNFQSVSQKEVENQLDIRAIRILIDIPAFYDYKIWQMDVKTTFLNGYLSEEVYMEQPEGHSSTPDELKRMQNVPYASAVGSIMYAVRCTRPDVAFAQNITSRFQQNPGDLHWTTLRVSCYTDAGYLTDADDLKSQTGYVFVLNGGVVDWKSAKQSIFATSSAEAEYVAAFDASKEAVWVSKFISRLGVVLTIEKPINMYCDNTGAIAIANEFGITNGARHFHAKVHYLRKVIEFGDIKLEKVQTDDNLADPFTKALAFPKHSEREYVMMFVS